MWAKEYKLTKTFIGRGSFDADLLRELTEFAEKNGVRTASISVIGAIQTLGIAYYYQDSHKYENITGFENKGPFEIVSCSGNVSIKDGKPFCHVHLVAADADGHCYAGHLVEGTKIFAAEIIMQVFEGDDLVRGFDEDTKLSLWQK